MSQTVIMYDKHDRVMLCFLHTISCFLSPQIFRRADKNGRSTHFLLISFMIIMYISLQSCFEIFHYRFRTF